MIAIIVIMLFCDN